MQDEHVTIKHLNREEEESWGEGERGVREKERESGGEKKYMGGS